MEEQDRGGSDEVLVGEQGGDGNLQTSKVTALNPGI